MGPFGNFDMAGNVREWCLNQSQTGGYFVMGGGWNDPIYSFISATAQSPFDRSATNGFRCIKEISSGEQRAKIEQPVERIVRDYRSIEPVSDEAFRIFLRQYAYDKTAINAVIEATDDLGDGFFREKVSFDAAYGDERVLAYLFLPKNSVPPFQTVIYFPGSHAKSLVSSENFRVRTFEFLVENGRALVCPIFKDTYERGDGQDWGIVEYGSNQYRDHVLMYAKDMGRTIDYLETRSDIDSGKLAYLGFSWGGTMAPIMLAVEDRFRASVLIVAGLSQSTPMPEVDGINFVTRAHVPTLILNGRYDHYFPLETSQKPMFDLFGVPDEDKRLVIYEIGHMAPRVMIIGETLDWLDKYLGAVGGTD
jgi:dienelactone hydrolase